MQASGAGCHLISVRWSYRLRVRMEGQQVRLFRIWRLRDKFRPDRRLTDCLAGRSCHKFHLVSLDAEAIRPVFFPKKLFPQFPQQTRR